MVYGLKLIPTGLAVGALALAMLVVAVDYSDAGRARVAGVGVAAVGVMAAVGVTVAAVMSIMAFITDPPTAVIIIGPVAALMSITASQAGGMGISTALIGPVGALITAFRPELWDHNRPDRPGDGGDHNRPGGGGDNRLLLRVGPSKLCLWRGDWHRDWLGNRYFRVHLATELCVRELWRLGVSQMRRHLVSAEL